MRMPWNPPAAVLGVMGRSQLNDRLLTILKQKFELKEVKMRTKIFFSVLVIMTITFLGMARPSPASHDSDKACIEDVLIPEDLSQEGAVQVDQEKKKEKEKTEKAEEEEDKKKTKDVFVWHMNEGEEDDVELVITDKGKTKTFTLKAPVIIIKKDASGKEIAITSEGNVIDIKKSEEGHWTAEGNVQILHEEMQALELGEGSVITIKTRTKDGHKVIEIEAPVVLVKKIENPSEHITVKVSEEGGKNKAVVVAPRVHVEHPDVHLRVKETELKNIHEKLQKIHEQLSKEMESKTEEEEQALKEMEKTLKKLEKKLTAVENKVKDITLSIHEEPHRIAVEHGHKISFKHKADTGEEEVDIIAINKDKDHLMSFVNEEGEATFLANMKLEKTQKQAFTDAVKKIEQDLPEGYDIKSEFDDESGTATIKIKGSAKSENTKDVVINLLKELKEKLEKKN